jgi:hypothetical protein
VDPGEDLGDNLKERLEALGRVMGEREAAHRDQLAAARSKAEELRARVSTGLHRFVTAAEAAGSPTLEIELSEPRLDDKHIRAIEFDLRRGRHGALVTVKSEGEITLVGPFRVGKAEAPCLSFSFDSSHEFDEALADFLERFLEAAMSP